MSVWQCHTDIIYFKSTHYSEKMTDILIGIKYEYLQRHTKKFNQKT